VLSRKRDHFVGLALPDEQRRAPWAARDVRGEPPAERPVEGRRVDQRLITGDRQSGENRHESAALTGTSRGGLPDDGPAGASDHLVE
jgi:hypothetical protein